MPPTRRDAITAGGLFGLGQVTPSRFPYEGRPQPSPGIGPSQGQVVRARTVIVFGPSGTVSGVFVYTPGTTPGLGNPPIAWMSVSTTDPFGNVLPTFPSLTPIVAADTIGDYTALSATSVLLHPNGAIANGSLSVLADVITLKSPTSAGVTTQGILTLTSTAAAPPTASLNAALTATAGTLASPTEVLSDTWHQVSAYINGWSGNANLDYRLAADDTIEINGRITNVAGTAGNSQVTTLTGYAPANRTEFAVGIDTNGNTHSLQLDTAGRFQVNTAVAAGGTVTVAVRIPRSAPA